MPLLLPLQHPDLIKAALRHVSDLIRADMCRTLVKIITEVPAPQGPPLYLYRWVFDGVSSLMLSSCATARNVVSRAFFNMAMHFRNRCAACSVEDVDDLVLHHCCEVNGFPDATEMAFHSTKATYLQALGMKVI